ncbi:MAG: hypothetical protein K2N74_04555 [Clostridiales bacterium]|nr:hypothetical protein [Clostridiales bacterium]
MKQANTTKKSAQPRTVDQLTFARMIAQKYGLKLSEVVSVIEEEQRLTMEYARLGYKIIKKNYLTIEGKKFKGKKGWKCPLNGKTYNLEPQTRVLVRVGIGFKRYISDKQMPDKLCRFVNTPVATPKEEVTA